MTEETVKCAYCWKERPVSEMKRGTIIHIGIVKDRSGRNKRGVVKTTNWYCADTPCHSHDQMSHEG